MTRRSSNVGLTPTGDPAIDQIQTDLQYQIDTLQMTDIGTLVEVNLDGTATDVASLPGDRYIVVRRNADATIFTTTGRFIRSSAPVVATLLVF